SVCEVAGYHLDSLPLRAQSCGSDIESRKHTHCYLPSLMALRSVRNLPARSCAAIENFIALVDSCAISRSMLTLLRSFRSVRPSTAVTDAIVFPCPDERCRGLVTAMSDSG